MSEAWVTLATNDGYAQGALVLVHSLRAVGTNKKIHCMVTNQVSPHLCTELEKQCDAISVIDVLNSNDEENLRLIGRPDLGVTFTKLHCWRLTQYTKAVFLDADTLVWSINQNRPLHRSKQAVAWNDSAPGRASSVLESNLSKYFITCMQCIMLKWKLNELYDRRLKKIIQALE
uniref:glycogenin glucosyltransferase n=1 Tax=Heterorhabditis bacteriophora TaxID=37862 RepID=A0A1I7XVY2_HETBA